LVSGQKILDVIPSVNSEFAIVAKPNGVVHLYSAGINMSEVKQIVMFTNDGDKVNSTYKYSLKKYKAKLDEQAKCYK